MPSLIPLDDYLGAILIGLLLSTVLYGVTCLQTYLYYTRYSKGDGRGLKALVAIIFVVDTFHVILLTISYYHYTVTNFGDYIALENDVWSLSVQVGVGALAGFLVQLFFAYRIYGLSERRIQIPGAICVLALFQLASLIAYTIIGFEDHYVGSMKNGARATIGCGLSANIACDLVIAAANIYFLEIRRTLSQRSNKAIKILIIYTFNTYILVTVFAIVCLITWLTCPGLIFGAVEFILVRLYPCSLLCLLNSRESIRRALEGQTGPRRMSIDELSTSMQEATLFTEDQHLVKPNLLQESSSVSQPQTKRDKWFPLDEAQEEV
ncbi:uncharacterized protein B0H18DRAFT_997092 [Fomitopsis serialis]|uniref:uncharacterized protein n=1 Tax=Fomitopsis serialis TaxID=139415 RepID=UPI0020086835|nr:uncharacterized protein B0H18DRAFT_997092 [Neoantrodia serialis]KAH9929408.1 hypothetical protein B0H18DRAFT_997092 [Neoantrodia serialis]